MIEATVRGKDLVIERIGKLGDNLRQALADAMRVQWLRIQAKVVSEKLSGDPLHRRTALLASSINAGGTDSATSFESDSTEIVGRVGTKVKYAKVHEYGGTFRVEEHQRRVMSRIKGEHTVTVRAHTATYPRRSFLRAELDELRPSVLEAIRSAVAKAATET